LQWTNQETVSKHQQNSPAVKKYKTEKLKYVNYDSYTLNETKVRMIKKILNDPKRKTRLKIIAKQFGISEMQLYRIKKGVHWGHVK
jgi:DNA-binding phage protein